MRVYEIDDAAGVARLIGSPRAGDASYEDSMPARLSDGRVVLVSDRGGRQGLYIASPDGAGAVPLSPAPAASDSDPASLGRDRVIFARADTGGASRDLFVVGIDGSGLVRLTRHPADDGAPCATPDGRSVVFVSDRDGAPRLYRLSLDAADPETTMVELSPPGATVVDGAPACLPGGSIAFTRASEGAPAQIYLTSAAGGQRGVRQITDPLVLPHGAGEPVSLGDGTILITGGPAPPPEEGGYGPRFAVYRITEGGYNLTRVTRDGAGYNDFARRLGPPS